jgi:hypothetical protein
MRGALIAVEIAGIEFGDPDPDQMPAEAVPLGERVYRLSA